MANPAATIMTLALMIASVAVLVLSRRYTRTSVDFYLAGKNVGYFANASAICGDYFSAASFLGVAAAVYASGLDGVWFATGFGAGFVPVLLFIAAPLRRFGEYTIPDFLGARFNSSTARIIGVLMVQMVIFFYMPPQMVGTGSTWTVLVGRGLWGLSPYSTGVTVAACIMVLYVVLGGMKGTTRNQVIHFWIFFTAVLMVVILAYAVGFRYTEGVDLASKQAAVSPRQMTVSELLEPDEQGIRPLDRAKEVMSGAAFASVAKKVSEGPEAEVWVLLPQSNRLHPERPMVFREPGYRYNWLDQFSMVIALVLGTAGLPHIMNRYYTSPSGRITRLTTVWVLALVAAFYMLASMAGVAARVMLPEHIASDPQLLKLTVDGYLKTAEQVVPILGKVLGGSLGMGYVAAGAFAAMFSTIGGLLLASAVSLGHDIYEQYINPDAPEWKKVAVGKALVVFRGVTALLIGLAIPHIGLFEVYPSFTAMMVTWAFAVAGGAFFPAFITSIWWKGTTTRGVIAGMLAGGGLSVMFIGLNILKTTGLIGGKSILALAGTLTYPSIFTIPIGILTAVVVSLINPRLPGNLEEIWAKMHGTARERKQLRLARLVDRTEKGDIA